MVLFNFPPNAGNTGTAAFLAVFESLFNTLQALRADGYTVEVPAERRRPARADRSTATRERFGAHANVHAAHPRRRPCARASAGCARSRRSGAPPPAASRATARRIFVLGAQFGNVFVGVQPAFGYEGDPMRLLFEKGFAPTHAFSAFYRWLREDFARRRRAAFRHPWRAGVHARQAGRPLRPRAGRIA